MGSHAILINWGSATWGQADSVLTFPCASLGWTVTRPKASNRETGAKIPYGRPLHFLIPQELPIREVRGPCEAPGTVVLRGAYSTILSRVKQSNFPWPILPASPCPYLELLPPPPFLVLLVHIPFARPGLSRTPRYLEISTRLSLPLIMASPPPCHPNQGPGSHPDVVPLNYSHSQ